MAEQRLIDANAAVELLRSTGSRDYRREKGTIADAIKMLLHTVYTPTVDAVEVVRCKDCKHFVTLQGVPCCDNFFGLGFPHPSGDDFCSYGERRTK